MALIDIARALGLARLEGSHFVDNPASARVLEKLGFEPRGHHRPAHELRARRGSAGAADAAAAGRDVVEEQRRWRPSSSLRESGDGEVAAEGEGGDPSTTRLR